MSSFKTAWQFLVTNNLTSFDLINDLGWYRDGYLNTDSRDVGSHTVCATMTAEVRIPVYDVIFVFPCITHHTLLLYLEYLLLLTSIFSSVVSESILIQNHALTSDCQSQCNASNWIEIEIRIDQFSKILDLTILICLNKKEFSLQIFRLRKNKINWH
jgi:hypothetical protein